MARGPLAGAAPSEEDGGLTYQRVVILGAHLFLSLAHVFAVHQSAEHSGFGEGTALGNESGDENNNVSRQYAYSPAMVVFLAELMKLVFSTSAFVYTHVRDGTHGGDDWRLAIKRELSEAITGHRSLRFAFPALVYLIDNHLRFVVLSKLASPITWVVFSHVEIPIVAVLSWAVLRRQIKKHQWVAILLLLDGVVAAEISLCHAKDDGPSCDSFAAYPIAALALVVFGAALGAVGGIACESLYKDEFHTSIHLQNLQLYLFGAVANGMVVMFSSTTQSTNASGLDSSRSAASRSSPTGLEGFTLTTWWVTVTLAMFGIVSSLLMKHLSNIAKVFNSAAGMVVVTIVSIVFLHTNVGLPFFLAAIVIVASLFSFYGSQGNDGDKQNGKGVLGPGSSSRSDGSAHSLETLGRSTERDVPSRSNSFAFHAGERNETKQLL